MSAYYLFKPCEMNRRIPSKSTGAYDSFNRGFTFWLGPMVKILFENINRLYPELVVKTISGTKKISRLQLTF